ncbi:hypothetical protein HBI25_118380 [Parastagonospora nodorum]|nr:hypothetical protein HBH61_181260 [Parastagonospora nodorum]KAH4942114.1 hypothetical protein HBH74_064480 [Parastagonospora nodorum]KAH4951722.1 hypothetical protein HBH73_104880 [Parastagonospora nodorum]KAH4994318.1 hypothetical protein HBI76_028050 [Parastagonospora nodorum]KAH5111628.1 hypothetical protein HBH72_014800 [Parastagonospora nodorum]
MLALCRPRCLLHSSRFLQTRTLRTVPRRVPTFIKSWDPTQHTPARQPQASIEPDPTRDTIWSDLHEMNQAQAHNMSSTEDNKDGGNPPKAMRPSYKKLRHLLRLASSPNIDLVGMRRHIWKAYILTKLEDPDSLSNLTFGEWDIIWESQSIRLYSNQNRTLHLEELYTDLCSSRIAPTKAQRIEYLACHFLNGKEVQALQKWEADRAEIESYQPYHCEPEHLKVGVEMYARAGNADRAGQLMEQLFAVLPEPDKSLMLTVFRAHTSSAEARHHEAAHDMYERMKALPTILKMRDYDACFTGFLEAKNIEFAKEVFRDMVSNGILAKTGFAKDVEEVLMRLHMLYRLATDLSSMTSIALHAIELLPQSYYGQVFGDWMKFTVVQQAPEAAAQILDMMYRQGYPPETFHFNMLLRAFIRTKESPNVLQAENIGWRMIDEARKAHRKNTRPFLSQKGTSHENAPTPEGLQAARKLPVADVDTFALIMHHHGKSLQWEHVEYLSRQLKETSIAPNATIMNVLVDNKIRQGAYAEAWSIYSQLTNPAKGGSITGVFPDGASIRSVWKMLRLALGDHATRHESGLPRPRELLKETVEWWALVRGRYDAERFRMGLVGGNYTAISALMLHCFSYTQDLPGSLVALHVLRHNFHIFPTTKDVNILQRQMAWVDLSRESASSRSQYFHSRSNRVRTDKIGKIYLMLLQQRAERMQLTRDGAKALTEEQKGDINLNLLSEFTRSVMKREYPEELVEVMIDAARVSVGCPDLPTGDMTAFEVA